MFFVIVKVAFEFDDLSNYYHVKKKKNRILPVNYKIAKPFATHRVHFLDPQNSNATIKVLHLRTYVSLVSQN